MKKNLSTILLVIIFFTGLSLLLYPSVSDYYNSFHQTRAIADYENVMENLSEEDYNLLWEAAREYNQNAATNGGYIITSDEQQSWYESLLNTNGTGMMGHIEIPSIRVSLPIYHNTEDSVLQFARRAFELEQSSGRRRKHTLSFIGAQRSPLRETVYKS